MCPKHRNSRRETAGWDRVDRQEVFVLCWKAGPSPNVGSAKGTGREVLADGHNPTQLPALLISTSRAPARAAESPKLSSPGAAPGRLANFVGPWLKSEAPALQAVTSGSVTGRTPPISTVLRGTRLKHRAKPHKLRQTGVIPAPATIFGK